MTLTGTVSKTYDGTTTATLDGNHLSASGAIGGDTVTLSATGGSYASANVGTGLSVTATGIAIDSAVNGAVPVYGYQLASTSAGGAVGTITAATLTYVATTASRTYGDANPTLGGTVTGLVNGDTLAGVTTGTLAFTTAADATSGVGSYAINGSGLTATSSNYTLAQAAGNSSALTVTARAVTITADAVSRIYGDANPLSGSATGDNFVNGDGVSSVALTTPATLTSGVGSYDLTASSATGTGLGNYALTYATLANGLTVTARALTVTADAVSCVYGNANPTLTYSATGMVNGDQLSGGLSTSAIGTSGVGRYAILQGSLTAGSNYALSYTGADLTVTARALTITPDAVSRIYGNANPVSGTATGDNFVNGDGVSSIALTTPATLVSGVGSYDLTGSAATGTGLGNYSIRYATLSNGLTITPRAVTITADAVSRIYGNANPVSGTATGDNFVNGDGVTSVSLTTPATATSGVGSYALTGANATGTGLGNYSITYGTRADGLTITPRALTIAANALSRVYGDANPALTFTTGGLGLVNGDSLSGALSTSATGISNVGSYAIGQGSLAASGNYTLTYLGATLVVSARPLTITGDTLSRTVSEDNPPLTYKIGGRGLVNGDVLTGALSTTATSLSIPGLYPIVQGSLAASANYSVTYVPGRLEVTALTEISSATIASSALVPVLGFDSVPVLGPVSLYLVVRTGEESDPLSLSVTQTIMYGDGIIQTICLNRKGC